MTAGLQITWMVNRGTPRTVELGASALIGSGRAADLRVPDPALAPIHLRLVRDGDEVTAIAVAAGVLLDGGAMPVDEPRVVTGRTLEVGPLQVVPVPHEVSVDEVTSRRGRTESLAREIVRELVGGTLDPSLAPELVVETGPASGQRLTLMQFDERIVVGRGENAGWVLLDPDLSRSHAAVVRSADGVRVHDLGSKNGTRVAGNAVAIGPPGELLEDGAIISLGETQVRFLDPAAPMLAKLDEAVQAQTTQTRPGHGRAVVAVTAVPEPPPPPRRRIPVAALVAALVALAAIALLIGLLASG